MSKYKLIAFDMDGTLLNEKKEISPESALAIRKAAEAGKSVVLCTGRGVSELEPYFRQCPEIRYLVCVNGAIVYDREEGRKISSIPIPADIISRILKLTDPEENFIHFLAEDSIMQRDKVLHLEDYTIGQYRELFDLVGIQVENIIEWFEADPHPIEKVNVTSTTYELRDRLFEELQKLPIEVLKSECSMIECTAPGIDKGVGLERLCEYMGIPTEEAIMVGDGNNDLGALRKAGLAVAMGNATPAVLEICDVVVADNDHGGCLEAVEKYLL